MEVQNATTVFKAEYKVRWQHPIQNQIEMLIASGLTLADTINPPLK